MSRIIAGEFTTQAEGQETRAALLAAGFEANDLTVFFNNAPGQHGDLPTGGDEYADPEARDAGKGAATGAAIGAGFGLAGLAAGPAGLVIAGVAAYVGSLAGTANAMQDQKGGGERRPAGVMVAVNVTTQDRETTAIRILHERGADNIEEADGVLENGNWIDFNPVSAPRLVEQSTLHEPGKNGGHD